MKDRDMQVENNAAKTPWLSGRVTGYFAVAVVVLTLLVILDSFPVLLAKRDFDAKLTEYLSGYQPSAGQPADCQYYDKASDSMKWKPDARPCLLDAIAHLDTDLGALVAASSAKAWTKLHPNDDGVRSAAKEAIARGWQTTIRLLPLLRAEDRFMFECSRAVLCGRLSSTSLPRAGRENARYALEEAQRLLGDDTDYKLYKERVNALYPYPATR